MADRSIPYFPGCTLQQKALGFDRSAREVMAALGLELAELASWNCCGATFPLSTENLLELSGPARILSTARQAGPRLAVACASCYNVLKRTNLLLRRDEEKREKIGFFIEADYAGDLEVLHLVELLREIGAARLQQAVQRPLTGLRVAAYYGCMLLRPPDEVGFDDPEHPTILDGLFAAAGAAPVAYPHRGECCGGYLVVQAEEAAMAASYRVLSAAGAAGADLVVTSCPLCQFNLDRRQAAMSQAHAGFRPLPVLYFTQLLGLALGGDGAGYLLERHYVDARPLLRDHALLTS
ncbi:MAG TPA: heterodisulfide reductase-related iron-sulfur binding cluster [Anaerolineae bacterium]|nr:heterodisulfide reductase-related iron-sulfur binding cluster [Anaerolineae bacterium]HOQ98247.1 heterodisulfide reductase-related iron-sulfur binding cluster [Anaerolineae bacterium]HPL27439.1 heterodisulfide reductase-related iron-sulfur binding cluster [Anaerolineae bacterium]